MPLTHSLRRLWTLDKFAYSLRVFIAFSGGAAVERASGGMWHWSFRYFWASLPVPSPRPTIAGKGVCRHW